MKTTETEAKAKILRKVNVTITLIEAEREDGYRAWVPAYTATVDGQELLALVLSPFGAETTTQGALNALAHRSFLGI